MNPAVSCSGNTCRAVIPFDARTPEEIIKEFLIEAAGALSPRRITRSEGMSSFVRLFHTVILPVATMREKPDANSTIASQAIFSEKVTLLEEEGEWVKIETIVDKYQGWTKKEVLFSSQTASQRTKEVTVTRLAAHLYGVTDTELGPILTLPFESRFELVEELPQGDGRWLKVKLADGTHAFIQRGDVAFSQPKLSRQEMVVFSKQFLGLPYTWGGRSSFGYDCSGFVQMLYRQMGVFLPRDSKDQIKWDGFRSIELSELETGDLIFWGKNEHKINNVGMYIGSGEFIHTIASVEKKPYLRISSLNDNAWDAKPENYHPYRAARTLK